MSRRLVCKMFEAQSRGQLHRKMLRLDLKLSNGGLPLLPSQIDVANGTSPSCYYRRPSTNPNLSLVPIGSHYTVAACFDNRRTG
jgi:hypothetical protein